MRREHVSASAAIFIAWLGTAAARTSTVKAAEQQQVLQTQRSLADVPLCACEPGKSKSICVRAAYPYKGRLVMMTELPKNMILWEERDKEVFCAATGERALIENFNINQWTHSARKSLTHTFAKISCSWSAKQRHDLDSLMLFVQSRSNPSDRCRIPLGDITHLPPSEPQPYRYKLCAMTGTLFNKGNFVDEWLDHQRVIGVEHIFAYTVVTGNQSLYVPAFEPTPKFQHMVAKGEITVTPWEPLLQPWQIYHRSQHLAYNDYLYRFRGMCEWTVFTDTDDFFIHFPSNHNLRSAIEAHEKKHPTMDQICYCWQLFYPDCGRKSNVPLVESLMYGRQDRPSNTKSVTRTINVTDIGIHKYHHQCRYVCGIAKMWHIRHDYPGGPDKDGKFHRNSTYCDSFRLPLDFYQQQGKRLN